MTITAAQCRSARGLIDLTQQALADAAGVSIRTIVDFEREKREPIRANLAAIQHAFEAAGIEFIENGVKLAGSSTHTRRDD